MYEKPGASVGELMKRIQQKDKVAFEVLYNNYYEAINGIVYRMVVSKNVADDLVQDVFVKVWKHSKGYKPEKGTFFTWLANIARNTCIDYLRSTEHSPRITVIEDDYQYNDIVEAVLPPVDTITIGELHALVKQLSPGQRQVIEMVYFRGFTHQETAEIISIHG